MTHTRKLLGVVTWLALGLVVPIAAWSGPVPQVDPFGNPLPSAAQARQQLEQLLGRPLPVQPPVRGNAGAQPGAPFEGPEVPVAFTLAEEGVTVQATSADLAETPEVRFTPEVLEVVQRLGGDPEQLYLYVKNGFEFTPYVGSQKGSEGTLQESSGNDVDLASLLLALLRAAGIPARYVFGSMYIPSEEARNWLGVDDPAVALQVLHWQGMPADLVKPGGGSLLLNRVWVEAFLVRHGPKPRWVPMDPAFKQYTVFPGSLEVRQVPFDRSEYLTLPVADKRTAYEFFRDRVQDHLDATALGTTIEDIERTREIVPTAFPRGLPGRLENRVRVAGELSTLGDDRRYRVTLYTVDHLGVSAQVTMRLPEIYGRRLTLSFQPATPADEALVQQYGGYYQVPADLLHVRPTIKLDGQTLVQGSHSVDIGQGHFFVVDFLFPGVGLLDRIFHTVFAGGYYALGLDTIGDANFILRDRRRQYMAAQGRESPDPAFDDTETGDWLSLAALRYLDDVEQQTMRLGALLANVQVKEVSEALTGKDIGIEFVDGILRFQPIGYSIDAKRVIARHFAVDGDESDLDKKWQIMGLSGSYLEKRLWEDLTATPSISTVNGLQFANAVGIPILTIDRSNVGTLLPTLHVFDHVRQAVADAVNAGRVVTIPRDTLVFHDWVGSVWIDDLPGGLSTGYLISGGLLGGGTGDKPPFKGKEPDCGALGQQLGDDKYKAIASTEGNGKWRQFDKEGQPLEGPGSVGTMQVNKNWDGKKLDFRDSTGKFGRDGTSDTIDVERVEKEWDYNVEVGKAILDDAERQAQRFFTKLGVTPTAEELAKERALLYNHSPGFWKYKFVNGKRVRDRFVEFHYYAKDPITGKLVKKDYSKDPDFSVNQRNGAIDSQDYADRYWGHLKDQTWKTKTPC